MRSGQWAVRSGQWAVESWKFEVRRWKWVILMLGVVLPWIAFGILVLEELLRTIPTRRG